MTLAILQEAAWLEGVKLWFKALHDGTSFAFENALKAFEIASVIPRDEKLTVEGLELLSQRLTFYGCSLLDAERSERAIEILLKAIELDPQNTRVAVTELCLVLEQNGSLELARPSKGSTSVARTLPKKSAGHCGGQGSRTLHELLARHLSALAAGPFGVSRWIRTNLSAPSTQGNHQIC